MSGDGRRHANVWNGVATVRPGLLVYTGTVGTATLHAHHSVQVFVARHDEIILGDAAGERLGCQAAVIPPGVPHEVVGGVDEALMVHLDPESAQGRELSQLPDPDDAVAGWGQAGGLLGSAEEIIDALPTAREIEVRHPAVRRTLRTLPELLDGPPIRLGELARAVNLSESRLAHLFSEEVGLPLRPYVQWLRLQRAAELVAAGASVTEAAHGAGFADGAHLSRICRRMFGIAPSEFVRATG
ncbi:helix-turn-helix transcriptional regulator [Actinomadura rudentiformis]|uniref:Helix-turn-helix transcriptional regulator n=1 Tax=Actinomadura rudentiformis TaxID=359158 RepID=A0A6H9YTM6_9ACTN|nr:helix-turn-helix transcriptional regulator [Actinomadura rudentiformis]KAB2351720.1 helix-turn-helix transcriptional regulator [Actinomadura rudentiformis]